MPKLILTRGIPASGKTQWAKAWVAEDPDNRRRINRDDLRSLFGIAARGTFAQEEYVTKVQRNLVQDALGEGMDVVVDDTNLRAKYAKEWLSLAQAAGTPVEFQDFPIDLVVAIHRDEERRAVRGRFVGAEVIEDFYKRYTPKGKMPPVPTLPENEQPKLKFEPYVFVDGLENAILVDVDNTLAHLVERSPYDPTLYHTDTYDSIVGEAVMSHAASQGYKVIVMSGRDAQYQDVTENWLRNQEFLWDELWMRPVGDTRNDAIVKNELYEQHIKGRFNVAVVYDDRARVVAMWRAKGMKVFQVEPGEF